MRWTWGTCLLLLLMFAWREIVISCKNWDKTILQLVYNATTSNKHFLFYGTKPSKDRVFQCVQNSSVKNCLLHVAAFCRRRKWRGHDVKVVTMSRVKALAKLPIKHKVISIFKCSDLLYTKFFAQVLDSAFAVYTLVSIKFRLLCTSICIILRLSMPRRIHSEDRIIIQPYKSDREVTR